MALPTEQRPIRMDPELAEQVDALLKPFSGEKLDRAQAAVMKVYESGATGSFGEILERYEAAIEDATQASPAARA